MLKLRKDGRPDLRTARVGDLDLALDRLQKGVQAAGEALHF